VGDVQEACWTKGRRGDNVGLAAERSGAEGHRAGAGDSEPGSITPHTKFKRRRMCAEGRGWATQRRVLHRVYRRSFTFRTTDVTGVAHLPEGVEMVSWAGRQCGDGDRVDRADSDGEGIAVCDP